MNEDKMELEEAILQCNNLIAILPNFHLGGSEAIATVLQELENNKKEIQDLKAVNAMQEYRINEMDIPKKKIEDKKKELKEMNIDGELFKTAVNFAIKVL